MIASGLDWFASLDWGFNAPFVCLWWLCLPDGRLHIVREWKEAGVYAEDFAARFWTISRDDLGLERPRYVVAGGDIANKSGIKGTKGESVKETLQYYRLPIRNADRDRKNGWYRVHELLRPSPYGTPWLTVDPSCTYLLRTLPAAPKDEDDEDEIDPHFSDDHGIESLRYGAMSRPSPTVIVYQRKRGEAGDLMQEAMRATRPGVLGSSGVRRSA